MKRGFTVIEFLIVLTIIGMIFFVAVACLAPEEKVTLDLAKWRCAEEGKRPYQWVQWVGKVPITHTGTRTECVQWVAR